MKILLAIEGSSCSEAAVEMVAGRSWPGAPEVRVISVVKPHVPLVSGLAGPAIKSQEEAEGAERRRARQLVERAAARINQGANSGKALRLSTQIFIGSPKRIIIEEAERWAADLIILGSHDYLSLERRLLGSVSQAVAARAACPVEIVRP